MTEAIGSLDSAFLRSTNEEEVESIFSQLTKLVSMDIVTEANDVLVSPMIQQDLFSIAVTAMGFV